MGQTGACPDSDKLQALLDGQVLASEELALIEHLNACPVCPTALEKIAAGDLALHASQVPTRELPPNSAYWAAIRELEKVAGITLPGADTHPDQDDPIDFLSPTEQPGHLGRLDHYEVVNVIGRGGMGVVLKSFDTHLQRHVALKVMTPKLANDETARKRFCREARAAAAITHENVVALHHVAHEESTDLPYLVMQLIDGESLEQRLERGRLPLRDIVGIGAQVASGLAAAHDKGLIHRDVKPANILIDGSTQRVKLTDFGLARTAEDVRLTGTSLVAGTPLYMAPEQARGEELDQRADLFSLGVVLYELCTGQTPFEAKTPLAVLKRLTDEPHRPVRQLNPDIPRGLADLIDRLLAKSPADRFQTSREVAEILDFHWTALRTSSDVVPMCPVKRAQKIRQTLVIVAAVIVGALLTAGAILVYHARHGGDGPGSSTPPVAVLNAGSGTVWGVAFAPDDQSLAMAIEDGTIKLWDVKSRTVKASLTGHRGMVWTVKFSKDGKWLVSSGDDNTARVWDLATNKNVHTLQTTAAVRGAVFDPEGKKVYTGDRQGNIRVFDLATNNEVATWQHPGAIFALALSPDGNTVATAGTDRVVRLWDAHSGQERLALTGHTGPLYGLAFRPDGKVLASAGWDRTIRLWQPGSGDPLRTIDGHARDLWAVDFSADGTILASAGQDGAVAIWDTATGKLRDSLRGHDGTVHSLTFSNDGTLIASGGRDGTVQLWQAPR